MTQQSYQANVFGLVKSLCGENNLFVIPKTFVQATGSFETALFLSQMLYWSDKAKRYDRYIYKTMKEWQDELMLSEYAITKARKFLKEKGILLEKIVKANGNPTVHYKIDENALITWFSSISGNSDTIISQETN